MGTLWQDVRYGVRMLVRNPGFTAVVVVILAVGIGANTAIFSVVNATLLRPLPYFHPEQLVQVKREVIKDSKHQIREFTEIERLRAWQRESRTFAALAGYVRTEVTLTGGERAQRVPCGRVTVGFFSLLGVQLPLGRAFLPEEDQAEATPKVVIVNQSFCRRYFPDEDPLGKQIKDGLGESEWSTIVGVVGDVYRFGVAEKTKPLFYKPCLQVSCPRMSIMVRTAGDPLRLAAGVRSQIETVDRDQPVSGVQTLEQQLSNQMAPRRTKMILLGTFAVLATGLAAAGIFAVISYTVAQRTHEIGVRMALGARGGNILKLVVKQGMIVTLAGVGAGLVVSLWLTRYLASMLYGVKPADPLTFAAVAGLLVGVAALACILPAWRAAKVDPMTALRSE